MIRQHVRTSDGLLVAETIDGEVFVRPVAPDVTDVEIGEYLADLEVALEERAFLLALEAAARFGFDDPESY